MEADVKWEQRPVVQASLDDLNMGLVTRFTGAARDTDLTVDLDEASAIEQTLRHAGLMTGVGTPTNAGILLLHNRPHQYIPPTVSAPPVAMVDRLGMRCTKPCSTRSPIRTTTAAPPCR